MKNWYLKGHLKSQIYNIKKFSKPKDFQALKNILLRTSLHHKQSVGYVWARVLKYWRVEHKKQFYHEWLLWDLHKLTSCGRVILALDSVCEVAPSLILSFRSVCLPFFVYIIHIKRNNSYYTNIKNTSIKFLT